MRKCIRCECEMRENYDVKVEGGAYGLKITKQGIFKDNLGKVRVAVCPECGYLEFYLEDTSKLKNQTTSSLVERLKVTEDLKFTAGQLFFLYRQNRHIVFLECFSI